ncbi:MAG TPA: pyrroline-5-carboxylate reductase [Actinomycetota bacterium]|nr:pyrroline-5-carboxylate reductase [Actinomycetota bacterium]
MSDGLAVLGCGKIGEILVGGLLASGWRKPEQILVTSRRPERAAELSERYGVRSTTSNPEAAREAGILVLAVKPTDVDGLLDEIASEVTPDKLVISVAAAISTSFIERRLPDEVPVVRAMPNAPAQVGAGVSGIAGGSSASPDHLAVAKEVLGHVGNVVVVHEALMDAVTAVSGSGPAYFALLAEAMIDAGIMLGLSRGVSTELVVQTMLGTARLLGDAKMHPVELREVVTSPGGTTIMAVRELEQAGVRAALFNAIQAAMERSRELAAGHE